MHIRKYGLMLSAAAIALHAGTAIAQQADLPAADQGQAEAAPASTADIVVTGSRIVRDGFEAPTPVSVISAAEIAQSAPVTVADFVNQLPALSGSETPRSPRGRIGQGSAGANFLNLRNLNPERTLVLLNGRRVTPSSVTGVADINTLPSALVERVDVVTGGASAAWGSDAVAGVVNFVLDTDFEGLKGQVQGGMTTQGDAETYGGDLSFGKSFANDRGHILLSGAYTKSFKANIADRDWFKAHKVIVNPAFAPGNGQPARLILPWTSINATDAGLIASGPLRGYYFNDDGTLGGTNFAFSPTISSIYAANSESTYNLLADQSQYTYSNVPVENGSIFGRLSYEVADDIKVFAEGSWSKAKAESVVAPYFRTGNTSVAIDNFFLPAEVRAAMTTAGVASVPISTSNAKTGPLVTSTDREVLRLLAGIEGKIGGWTFAVSYQYGKSDVSILASNNIIRQNYANAIDAVADPASPGNAICRSTLTNPGNGCVVMNPFGNQAITQAQADYLLGVSRQDLTYRQDVASFSLSGDLFDLPAGAVSLATGLDYRTEKAEATSDAISQASGFYAGNFKPFYGKYNVKEVFAELAIPVFKDSPIGTALDLSLAGRVTDYSTSGTVKTWKAGFTYKPFDDLDIRFTRSRDIRAPNLNELFLGGTVITQNVSDPANGGANTQFLQTQRGNAALDPERANTLTLGAVYKPSWLPGFATSIDYYDIKIQGAIATNSSQQVVNRCFAGEQIFCNSITRNASNIITAITIQPFNALSEVARGIDVEMSYRTRLGAGQLDLRGLVNYVDRLDIIAAGSVVRRAGEVGNNVGAAEGVPSFRGLASATYSQGPATVQLKGRFISASKIEKDWGPADINLNKVPAIFYLDGYVSYKLDVAGSQSEIFFAMDNILDQDPPVSPSQDNANVVGAGTNVLLYDILGRSVRAGIRFKF